ncbi:hypothetical protein Pla111_24110 [Botrimarina hoheduenensis]|uniref:Uncharacterized protein n=1 Tax=Botrimarina hoheduenensis TaxID=2528000 RepID=A0A5C5VYG3_9BACT|nr:hypothetical protein Pla111_24110 [Botrimarina hoheduenensis]
MSIREADERRFELKYSVGLSVRADSETLGIPSLVGFLSSALTHAKEERDGMVDAPSGAHPQDVPAYNQSVASVEYRLLYDDSRVSPSQLTEALADALARADTLAQIIDSQEVWSKRAATEPASGITEIIRLCGEPGGTSRAFALMLARAS